MPEPGSIHDAAFLWNEVQLAGDRMLDINTGGTWNTFTCQEAEALACIFSAAGRQDVYDFIIHEHALEDEAEEVEFHLQMRDGTEPPEPLGRQ